MAVERIDSPKHPALRAAAALAGSTLARAAAGRYLVESEGFVDQALAADVTVHHVFVAEEDDAALHALEQRAVQQGVSTYRLTPTLFPKLTGTGYTTRVRAVAVVARRPLPTVAPAGLLLIGERIQDPRNIGVLLRTAEAAGVTATVFSDDSADPYSRPAVRSSTGSVLRQPIHLTADVPALLAQLSTAGVRIVAGSARAAESLWTTDLTGPVALVVGNETQGLTDAARAAAAVTVALPVHGAASSLNVTVAAGVLLYEALRQRQADGPR